VPAGPPAGAAPKRRDPRWEESSPLNFIEGDQTPRNEAGRQRLDQDGNLAASPETRRVTSAQDAAGADFLYIENFFTTAECEILRHAFNGLQDRLFTSDRIDPYWNGRFVWLKDILAAYPEAGRIMIQRQRQSVRAVSAFYRLKAPIYSDLLQIVQWKPGMSMPQHADNVNPDRSPHGMAYRDLSGVAYLNDDYEGGELYFTALDIAIKPKRGAFLAFSAGFHHEHAVLRVASGSTRLTIPSFYTFNPAKADPLLHPEAAQRAAAQPAVAAGPV